MIFKVYMTHYPHNFYQALLLSSVELSNRANDLITLTTRRSLLPKPLLQNNRLEVT
jgi:hypothetical protein